MFNVRNCDLRKLNSATKYPSIPTYHQRDPENGNLLDASVPFEGKVLATEKIDGTNTRIIVLPGGSFILGSREELLYARGDLIGNSTRGIVEALKTQAENVVQVMGEDLRVQDCALVFYCELYGGRITKASKQYTGIRKVGFRLFDVAEIRYIEKHLDHSIEVIAAERERGGQYFLAEAELMNVAKRFKFDLVTVVTVVDEADLPHTVEEGNQFLKETFTGLTTFCALDNGAKGTPEGLVLRTSDRKSIAKLRFQDYHRTLRRRRSVEKKGK